MGKNLSVAASKNYDVSPAIMNESGSVLVLSELHLFHADLVNRRAVLIHHRTKVFHLLVKNQYKIVVVVDRATDRYSWKSKLVHATRG